ncbi:low molecular weight protein arginine phosphatase [Alkalicoccobacillus porphyridii]|uniref:Low molecular weight protein arginine phosphatase n=1 Tax=Alkalicoccobacillus porphyridii TaxID=2597270 RepID=A0A553ZTF4_9BACI|nr:low molecular weight protein arginine phosphatase [Alkalicoccobacillus porphyridii]TSB44758.1 low molecular weight protein arginine phosphatase [Alkalicoccobacillus porphyridii]
MKNILFVCTGNTCRSPLAEYLLKEKAGDVVAVQSAGVTAWPGVPMSEGSADVLNRKGIHHRHVSQSVTPELLEWADIVLTMTRSHKEMLTIHHASVTDKVFTLKEFTAAGGDIADPVGGPQQEYDQVAAELEKCVNDLLKKIE